MIYWQLKSNGDWIQSVSVDSSLSESERIEKKIYEYIENIDPYNPNIEKIIYNPLEIIDNKLVLRGKAIPLTQEELDENLASLKASMILQVKAEANRRIIKIYEDFKQRNSLAQEVRLLRQENRGMTETRLGIGGTITTFSDNGSGGTTCTSINSDRKNNDMVIVGVYESYGGTHRVFNCTDDSFDIPITFSTDGTTTWNADYYNLTQEDLNMIKSDGVQDNFILLIRDKSQEIEDAINTFTDYTLLKVFDIYDDSLWI